MVHQFLKSIIKGVTYAAIAVLVLWLVTNYTTLRGPAFPSVSEEKWQAVFLGGGQVYFGKLVDLNSDYVTLSDVYYLKETSDLQQSNLNLVKLGGELHGPEDVMYIHKASISYWENMKESSRVVQSIQDSKQ